MGSITKTAASLSTAAINLTSEGSLGWADWSGANLGFTVTDSKAGGPTITATQTAGSNAGYYQNDPRTKSWSGDGTPNASGSNTDGRFPWNGTKPAIVISIPADTTAKKVRIHTGAYNCNAEITASLSDASASPVADTTTFDDSGGVGIGGYIEFTFQADSGGQTLSVELKVGATEYGSNPNVTILAATVQNVGATAAVLSSPDAGTVTTTSASPGASTDQTTGTAYVVVDTPANLSGVTASEIKAGQKAGGASALAAGSVSVSASPFSIPVASLPMATDLAYAIVQNNTNGDSNIVTGTFTTLSQAGDTLAGGTFLSMNSSFGGFR